MRHICHLDYHAPDDVRVFTIPEQGVRRFDSVAVVYDVPIGRRHILRHYSFTQQWFQVNCTFDRSGQLEPTGDAFRWSFNCDICTPCFVIGDNVYDMDLDLDVLVSPDGAEHLVKDEAEFAEALTSGWITAFEAEGARRGLSNLLGLVAERHFLSFLEEACPFDTLAPSGAEIAPRGMHLQDVPWLQPAKRGDLYGKVLRS